MYNHVWMAPAVTVRFQDGKRPLHVPLQECGRCGTTRNPVTGKIIHFGDSSCRDNQKGETPDWTRQLERVEEQLSAMRDDGLLIDRYYGGT